MKTKPPFDGEIHAVSAKKMPDLNSPKREPGWFLGEPTPTRDEAVLSVDALAQEIRRVDGSHSLGAGALAEALMPFLLASAPAPASGRVDAVAVKALEWKLQPGCSATFYAESIAGTWEVWQIGSGYVRGPGERAGLPVSGGLDGAKAAAQADYEQRIRSALSPAATPVSEAGGDPFWDSPPGRWDEGDHNEEPYPEALAKPASSPAGVRRVRHKKRGGIYEVLGEAQVQASRPLEDYEVVVIYRSLNTPDIDDPASPMKGDTWIRPKAEFNDGRFEELSQSISAGRVGE